jgi:hypothetical protein
MIIEFDGIDFDVTHDFEDDEMYISSIQLDGQELVNLLDSKVVDSIYDEVVKCLDHDAESARFENTISDWDENHE